MSSATAVSRETPAPQSPPIPANQRGSRISTVQRARIVQRYAAGQSIRRIAREEKRDRSTVTRVVRGPEVQALVTLLRRECINLTDLALDAVRCEIAGSHGAKLAYQLLTDLGVVPSEAERLQWQQQSMNAQSADVLKAAS